MGNKLSGKVRCKKISNSRAVRRFVAKQIENWIASQKGVAIDGTHFDVTFNREGDGHLIGCRVQVSTRDQVWTATSCTEGLQRALSHCLARMMPRLSNAAFSSPPS